jgi:hypothetical protein
MMGFGRKRPARHGAAIVRDRVETLESRALLTAPAGSLHFYQPIGLVQPHTVDLASPPISIAHPIGSSPRLIASTETNEGKVVTGQDRQGNTYTITVRGPGEVIVTDTTPNDGALDDSIDTIQLVGTDIHKTVVVGQTSASSEVITDSTVLFNHLISLGGVKAIILNGFTLTQTIPPPSGTPNNSNTGIFLPGGVGTLEIHDVIAPVDLSTNDLPVNIIIGQPNSPTTVAPTIKIDSIFATVFDSTVQFNPNGVPVTTPTVNVVVNGDIHKLDLLSATQQPIPAGFQAEFPVVGTTGRTVVRAIGIDQLKVTGSAKNFTASRQAVPFSSGFSGLNKLNRAQFGGNADAVGLDVNGPVGTVKFARGLGNPAGSLGGASNFGLPDAERGYPSFGLMGGLVTGTHIRHVVAAPANLVLQTSMNPALIQLGREGSTTFIARPGNALTNAAITSSGSISHVNIVGNSQQSEIKSGFYYPAFAKGLEGTRARSHISHFKQRGDLLDSVVSATYRPTHGVYGATNAAGFTTDVAGPGSITGRLNGRIFLNASQTALSNFGTGIYARHKHGYLPPPQRPLQFRRALFV